MTKVWGIHMPEWVGDRPVEGGFVCVGWPEMGNIFALPADRDEFKRRLTIAYPDKKQGAIPVDAGTLYRFAHEITNGDIIVYPSKHNRMVNVGQATGDRWHKTGEFGLEDDLPNFLGVRWIGIFPRSEFSQAALNEIGSFITLFSVRKHSSEFLLKIGNSKINHIIEDESEQILSDDAAYKNASILAQENAQDFVIRRIHTGMDGHEFEQITAHLMECMGYAARVTEKSGDGGVDVIAHTDALGFQPPIIKIQCKRQTSQVGEPEVSQLLGTLGEGEYALFVTLGSYTRQARIRERNTPRLRLIDGEDFVDLILQHYEKMSPRYRALIPLKQIFVPDPISN